MPEAKPDWSMPKVDSNGVQLASDGLPLSIKARAMRLASDGKASDPLKMVTPEQIKAHARAPASAAPKTELKGE